jgi:hypothetical protein
MTTKLRLRDWIFLRELIVTQLRYDILAAVTPERFFIITKAQH